eukprot:gene37043-18809_t
MSAATGTSAATWWPLFPRRARRSRSRPRAAAEPLRLLRHAQDELHDRRARYCDTLRRQMVHLRNHCTRTVVLEQNRVTGHWKPLGLADWSLAHFQDRPDWQQLKGEVDHLEYVIANFRDAMVALLRAASDHGVTTLVDPTDETPYDRVRAGYEHLVRTLAAEEGRRLPEDEVFSLLHRRLLPIQQR